MLHGLTVIDEFAERINPDPQMDIHESRRDHVVTGRGLDAFGHHRLIRDKQEGSGWDLVMKAGNEEGGRLHVDPHATDAAEIFFEGLVMLPDAAVSRVNGAGPVIEVVVADGG